MELSAYLLSGVNVIRCPIWIPEKPSAVKRIMHLLSFAITSFPAMLFKIFKRPDIILVTKPPIFCVPTSLFFSWLYRSRSWLHIQDFEVDAAFELNLLSSNFIRDAIRHVEYWLMRRFNRVSSISEKMMIKLNYINIQSDK